jgi:excinuclease ABC subunit B
MMKAVGDIEQELAAQIAGFQEAGKLLEAQRIEQRTRYDLEMIREIGFCKGIENYSRYITGRLPGEPPYTLIDFFPRDFVLIIDESHVGIPQLRGMFEGDYSRKRNLVDFGFRLPSALDNRPLRFEEFRSKIGQIIFTSATPGPFELEQSQKIVEQLIRPTGLIDPEITVKPTANQVDDLLEEIQKVVARDQRVLITTLTKRMAEDLTDYLSRAGLKVRYMHSDVEALQRLDILRDLRLGEFDVLVGINLLREGLDLPEVSLVAILDADKEGFLRSERSLIQTVGRAARNVEGRVIMYGDGLTPSMSRAIEETNRRRKVQLEHNLRNNIVPRTVEKGVRDRVEATVAEDPAEYTPFFADLPMSERKRLAQELEKEMKQAAERLDFEKAAQIRDMIKEILSKKSGPGRSRTSRSRRENRGQR